MDVFGKRFQKELEQMKRDVAKWQTSPDTSAKNMNSPPTNATDSQPHKDDGQENEPKSLGVMDLMNREKQSRMQQTENKKRNSLDRIPLLDGEGHELSNEKKKQEQNETSKAHATGAEILNDTEHDGGTNTVTERR